MGLQSRKIKWVKEIIINKKKCKSINIIDFSEYFQKI